MAFAGEQKFANLAWVASCFVMRLGRLASGVARWQLDCDFICMYLMAFCPRSGWICICNAVRAFPSNKKAPLEGTCQMQQHASKDRVVMRFVGLGFLAMVMLLAQGPAMAAPLSVKTIPRVRRGVVTPQHHLFRQALGLKPGQAISTPNGKWQALRRDRSIVVKETRGKTTRFFQYAVLHQRGEQGVGKLIGVRIEKEGKTTLSHMGEQVKEHLGAASPLVVVTRPRAGDDFRDFSPLTARAATENQASYVYNFAGRPITVNPGAGLAELDAQFVKGRRHRNYKAQRKASRKAAVKAWERQKILAERVGSFHIKSKYRYKKWHRLAKDPYTRDVIKEAEIWGRLLQYEIDHAQGEKPAAVIARHAKRLSFVAGLDSGHSLARGVRFLADTWVHGKALLKLHNQSSGYSPRQATLATKLNRALSSAFAFFR